MEKCGPLCQHPGCWHSGQRLEHGKRSGSYYLNYLSHLVSRQSKKLGRKDVGSRHARRSSLTKDGLPTLKVQTLEQDHVPINHHGYPKSELHARANTLPPVVVNTQRRRSRLSYSQKMKAVHFLQMHLEDDTNDLQENELVYSPVLIWKPGKQPHTHHHTHPPRYHTCTPVHVELLDHSSEGPSIHPTETRHSSPGRSPSPTDNNARKSPLHMNRTDLTLSLPPRDSSSELLNKMNGPVKGQRRVTTADAESFSYLGDIPTQVVADILQQLRSESTSNIDEPHLPKSSIGGREHLPSSLIYNQSTNKISDTKQTTPILNRSSKARITSFSRELSKRPLELLRKRSSDHKQLQPITEQDFVLTGEDGEKTVRTLKPSTVHLDTIRPPTPNIGHGRHSLQLDSIQRQADPHSKHVSTTGSVGTPSLAKKHLLGVGISDDIARTSSSQVTSAQHVTTKTVTLELDVRPSASLEIQDRSQSRDVTPKRVKPKGLVLTPSYNSPRPFSEETNATSVVTPATGSSHSLQELPNINLPTDPVEHTNSQDKIESRVMSSVSPDFMLVGAHFAGDHLVLVDRGEPTVHQLTDTDSIVNIRSTHSE